ncbi:hypothetical protein V3C99_014505 [Haemonchus contortus]
MRLGQLARQFRMWPIVILILSPLLVHAVPEQVHLAFHGNFSSMGVVWTTFDKEDSIVHYGSSPSRMPYNVTASRKSWNFDGVTRYTYKAVMKGLLPDTVYWYKIGSRTFQFKTMPEHPKSYRVCIFGDLGYEHGNSTASIIRNGLAGKFDFIVHVGDIAYDLHSDSGRRGDKFLNELEPITSRVSRMVVAGNHENDGKNFTNFQERFQMPSNGFHDNQFYSFDLGPIHWVALSTEYYGYYDTLGKEPVFNQYNWLKEDLKVANTNRKKTPWIVAYLHRPFYCSAAHDNDCTGFDNEMIRAGYDGMPGLEKPFLKYGLDLGFWGHIHNYERLYPVADMQYWDSADCYHNAVAPTYIVTGSAGCHSPGTKFDKTPEPFSARRLNDYGYTILTVANATHIHLEQISIDKGEAVVDSFWLSKDIGFIRDEAIVTKNGHKFGQGTE